jgi:uncharacterized RDD family membrane protein YckC
VKAPSLFRHLAALLYDGLIVLALWLFGTFLLALLIHPARRSLNASESGRILYWGFLLALAWIFLAGFWSHGGQTLGLKAWRLKLVQRNGQPVNWSHATVRFLVELIEWLLIGVFLLPVYFLGSRGASDRTATLSVYLTLWLVTGFLVFVLSGRLPRGSLHDRLSRTRLIRIESALGTTPQGSASFLKKPGRSLAGNRLDAVIRHPKTSRVAPLSLYMRAAVTIPAD